eukprot:CAMPEP_0184643772 /NCGR_PEP_ID=MMETSP0308-20130426/602_1 /TAXON_ID=38269 /ORGANISM="Gloeochaete witrockiana, Strain SAG 46.84" /LENGTH=317 /DNA_ID=CAMNT_0027071937 /DNA_START=211 /DNA_END=1164 /DNA_ORIENTATION=+
MSSAQLENSKSAELDFTAAGILPYCWVPNLGGEAMFLLGEELCWSRRPRDNKLLKGYFWKDFGGRRESEECVEETAAREFSEETLGVFANDVAQAATNSGVLQSTRMMLAKLLSARDQVDGHDGIFKAKNGLYVMYAVPVDYIDGFSLAMARQQNNFTREISSAEKRDFSWVSSGDIHSKLNGHASYTTLCLSRSFKKLRVFRKFMFTLRGFSDSFWSHILSDVHHSATTLPISSEGPRTSLQTTCMFLNRRLLRMLGAGAHTVVERELTFSSEALLSEQREDGQSDNTTELIQDICKGRKRKRSTYNSEDDCTDPR